MKDLQKLAILVFLVCLAGSCLADVSHRLAPPLTSQIKLHNTHHGAEVLWSIVRAEENENGHWQNTYYYSIRLNDLESARDYGRIVIPFNHYYSDLEIDFAKVLSKDNKLSTVASEAIQLRVTGGGQDFYSDSSEYVFSLPDIEPGSTIEFQFTRKSKELALPALSTQRANPYWIQRSVGGDAWRMDYVHNHQFSFSYPASKHFFQKSFQGYPTKAKIKRQSSKIEKSWQMKKVPALTTESWMPSFDQMAPQILLSTHKDWSVVDAWTWKNVEDKIKPTKALIEIAENLDLDDNASYEQKIKAVYQFVQHNVRYVFAHLGRGGYEPHFASDVVESSYGDCKDQTVLTVALLNILGIKALPALVETPRAGKHDTSLVKLIFDHMIVYIPKTDTHEAIWLDTTGDRTMYPGMSNYLFQQNALIINGQGGRLTTVTDGLEKNTARLELNYSADNDGQITVHAELHTRGIFEQNLRSWWVHDKQREASLEKRMRGFFSEAKEFTLTSHIKNTESLWKPVVLVADYAFSPSETPEDPIAFATSFSQLYNQFGQLAELQSPESRLHSFVDQYAYDFELHSHFAANTEENPVVVQSSGNISNEFLQFTQHSQYTDTGFEVKAQLHQPSQSLSVKEYGIFYQTLEKVAQSDSWIIVLQKNEVAVAKRKLRTLKQHKGENNVMYVLALAKNQIESGLFEEALQNAEKAVALDAENGEAWYFLGMAQGFNSLIDESSSSFEKAESLGYLP